MNNNLVVYLFTNKINNKSYIGITKDFNKRIKSHKRACDDTYFHNSIRKYGFDNFEYEIIDESNTYEELQQKEIMYIAFYKELGVELYNRTFGGEGNLGWIPSEDTRKIWSTQRKGKNNWSIGKKRNEPAWNKGKSGLKGELNGMFGKKHKESTKKLLRGPRKKIKKNGFKGVSFNYGKYIASIWFNNKLMQIGRFDIQEVAAAFYDRKAIELFGDDAVLNFNRECYVN